MFGVGKRASLIPGTGSKGNCGKTDAMATWATAGAAARMTGNDSPNVAVSLVMGHAIVAASQRIFTDSMSGASFEAQSHRLGHLTGHTPPTISGHLQRSYSR